MDVRKAKTVGFFAAMAAVLAVFIFLSLYDQPPRLPPDKAHPRHGLESSCVECHGPTGEKPLNKRHTERRACLKCHKPV
jgi:hypothetical protein